MKFHSSLIRDFFLKILELISICFIKLFKRKAEPVYQRNPDKIKNILFVRIDRIGDMLLLTPAIRSVKKFYKFANIYVLANSYNKDILLHNKNITEVIIYEKNPLKYFRLIKKLKKYKFDIAIDSYFGFNIKSAIITYLSDTKIRLGYYSKNAKYFFNRIFKVDLQRYEALKHLELVKTLGINDTADDISLELPYSEEGEKKAVEFLNNLGAGMKFVGINPGARRKTHLWQPEKFAKLADLLIKKYGVSIIITWGPKEFELATGIKNKMIEKVSIAYPTNILELSALISKFRLFICSDTSPFHIAVADKVPAVVLFGKGDYLRWAPSSDNVRVIKNKKIKDISIEEVLTEVEYILEYR